MLAVLARDGRHEVKDLRMSLREFGLAGRVGKAVGYTDHMEHKRPHKTPPKNIKHCLWGHAVMTGARGCMRRDSSSPATGASRFQQGQQSRSNGRYIIEASTGTMRLEKYSTHSGTPPKSPPQTEI